MKLARQMLILSFVVLLLAIGCSSESSDVLPDTQIREDLLAKTMLDADYVPSGPVHNGYFTPLDDAGLALHDLNGSLSVAEFEMQDTIPSGDARSESGRYFPGFTTEFFTYDDYLVPVNREILPPAGENSRWRLILSPGKVWSEAKDDGLSRASFPFVLVSQTSNEAHNGLASFLYADNRVSNFFFQITQETSAWNRNDYWGQAALSYSPGPIKDEADLRTEFTQELASQVDIKPWSGLASRVNDETLAAFDGGLHPEEISASGLIMEESIYLQPSVTRYGQTPYDRYIRHGVFSVTKSMAAAVALLRLAEKYGDQVFNLKIADYVEVSAAHDGWQDVTFGNALSMATGVGDMEPARNSSNFTADEDEDKFLEWLEMASADEKLTGAFAYGNYDWGPGEVARYNSITTFVLGAAMDAFLKGKEGPEADIWHMVEEEVYQPIGVFHAPIMRTLEPDGGLGLPIFGYGLYPTVDDTAKITTLLQSGGRHEGEQLLSPTKLEEALYQTDEQGLSIFQPNQYGDSRYLHSFWSVAHCEADDNCYQVPYMLGFGGNIVVLLPNDVTVFRYADSHYYDPEPLVALGEAVR